MKISYSLAPGVRRHRPPPAELADRLTNAGIAVER